MPVPTTTAAFLECVGKSGVVNPQRLEGYLQPLRAGGTLPGTPRDMARLLVQDGMLTFFQAEQLERGKWRNFILKNKYIILERLGCGGYGNVFLCGHLVMRRHVALKVLPPAHADNPGTLERFHREARAGAQLRHPNIAVTHDIDHTGKIHFLVMEYVDGSSLQEIVERHGSMDLLRASHYVHQAALGLQHAHESGLIHRDIKPSNILLDRCGRIKILDLGLARFFNDTADNLTRQFDSGTVLGTADYLAPEQALDSRKVDIRGDIYSLGITFYFLVTGATPFHGGTMAQKLIWHQLQQPRPVKERRPDIPDGLAAVIDRMIAKDPAERYQTPAEVAAALSPWMATPIGVPPEKEMPQLSVAARNIAQEIGALGALAIAGHRSGAGRSRSRRNAGPSFGSALSGIDDDSQVPAPPGTALEEEGEAWMPEDEPASSRDTAQMLGTRMVPTLPDMPKPGQTPAVQAATVGPATIRTRRPSRALIGGLVAALALGAFIGKLGLSSRLAISQPDAGVRVEVDHNHYRVRAPGYEAVVEADGCLTSLRVGGVEYLQTGVSGSRGVYFRTDDDRPLVLRTIEQPAPHVIMAQGDMAAVRYEFGLDTILCQVTNASNMDLPFVVVFNPAVAVVRNDQGEEARTPVCRDWTTTIWLAGKSQLTLDGGTGIRGPWAKNFQVLEARLAPRQSRWLVWKAATPSES